MRSSILLASALAMGAIAGPIDRRALETVSKVVATVEVDYAVKVDELGTPYTTQALTTRTVHGGHEDAHKAGNTKSCTTSSNGAAQVPTQPAPKPSTAAPAPVPETTETPPPPAPETIYQPAPTPTEAYVPAPAPSSSDVYVPEPEPSTSTQAPAPSSAPAYGVTHKSGEIQATFSSGEDYQNAVLWHHNRARANHGAENLQWSEDCVAGAQKAAATCVFKHVTTDGQGQNLYTVSGDAYNATAGITEAFYKAEADIYHYWGQEPPQDADGRLAGDWHDWGHLTQVVWKETTHVGCVSVYCPTMYDEDNKKIETNMYTVCNYSPPGNVASKFSKNVVKPSESYNSYSWLD